jgi:hypothetical protein
MKRLIPQVLISVLILASTALLYWDRWVNAHRIAASPQNETALYQNYDPEPVIKKFRYEGESYGGGSGIGSGNGIKSIQHSREFMPRFTMQANRQSELMKALHEDVLGWLRATSTNVVASHEESNGGFTYKYASGNSVGSISVKPPNPAPVHRNMALPAGLEDVTVTIAMEETWTRPANETQWWMAMAD